MQKNITEITGHNARFLFRTPEQMQLSLTLTNGSVRSFLYTLPTGKEANEAAEALVSFTETVGNLLACLGGQKLTVYPGKSERVRTLLKDADMLIRGEKGCARAIRVADRINAALGLAPLSVEISDTPILITEQAQPSVSGHLGEKLHEKAKKCLRGIRLGIDVGGTDIKAVSFLNGQLAAVKEFDWAPAEYGTPEQITRPIVLIAQLLSIAAAAFPAVPENIRKALEKDAPLSVMEATLASYKAVPLCDSIGLSYPDVVIRDRIVGGETPKTRGMQRHDPEHYEEALLRLAAIRETLEEMLIPGGSLHMANDGNIAAYTAAVELSFTEAANTIDRGVFAHSLGTDLGTGLLLGNGEFPEAPLELYTFRTGKEEAEALARPPKDIRSARTVHSRLRGAERRVGQAAAFRYAYALEPRLLEGFIKTDGDTVQVITEPEDKRKALLEHLMAQADAGDKNAEEVFIRIGRALGEITNEAEALLRTGMDTRYVFGRFVKRARVFALIAKGFSDSCPEMRLIAADSALTKSPLMCALAAVPAVTVAQFGQAVGSVYYGA